MTEPTPRAALYAAMAKAFPAIEGASKDSTNPHFKSKYADLSAVVAVIKPALADHGLWFRQITHERQTGIAVETLICHASGEELSCGTFFAPARVLDAQGYGSALTYARRYSLQTAFGVAPEDDDGNAAVKAAPKSAPAAAPANKINEAQLKALQAALDELPDGWTKRICDGYQIEALPDLLASAYPAAFKKLTEHVAKHQAQRVAA